jgi:hypothetical protein
MVREEGRKRERVGRREGEDVERREGGEGREEERGKKRRGKKIGRGESEGREEERRGRIYATMFFTEARRYPAVRRVIYHQIVTPLNRTLIVTLMTQVTPVIVTLTPV